MLKIDLNTITAALDDLDRPLLAARLKLARQRKFPSAKAASDALAEQGANKSSRSYHSHESGERHPKLRDLSAYAALFEVALEYLIFGGHDEISETEIEAQALINRKKLQKRLGNADGPPRPLTLINGGKSVTSSVPVNQVLQRIETTAIHNPGVRFIPIISASEIRHIINGRGGLTTMSGQKLPVPQSLPASEHSYSYQIPDDDLSMMSTTGASFGPGTYIVADREAAILPGKYVLAMIAGFDEPVFRIYKAAKPYAPGVAFSLHPLNPAYDQITINNADDVESIERVIYTASAV